MHALWHLHEIKIVHRDLKPENLLIDHKGYLRVIDFGFAKRLSENKLTHSFKGSPMYVAREVVLRNGHTFEVDYWSASVILYELYVGKVPFDCTNISSLFKDIVVGTIDFPILSNWDTNFIDFLISGFTKDPVERKKLMNKKSVKKMKLFASYDWDNLLT